MVNVIGVRFQQNGKMTYFDADSFLPVMGDYVVVQTPRGEDLGEVIMGVRPIDEENMKMSLQKMLRVATEADIECARENRAREEEAFAICQQKITEHKLEMKLVNVECSFDNSKILFYFTANGRVDFRTLVRDLASVFKTRIELRQIGVRDEARMLGGLGPCGRPICCGAFLNDFQPVSIKMAKEQNLSLNPTKISGVCGRLMCCLKYEQDQYEQTRKRMPRVGREVHTPDGNGTVTALNVVKETVSVRIIKGDDGEIKEYPLADISRTDNTGVQRPARPDEKEAPEEMDLPEETAEEMMEPEKDPKEGPAADDGRNEPETAEENRETVNDGKKNRNPVPGRESHRNRSASKPGKGRNSEGENGRNRALGQVVRRENPARAQSGKDNKSEKDLTDINTQPDREAMSAPKTEAPERKMGSETAAPAPVKKKNNAWAAALEEAIKAADEKEKG